MPRAQIGNVTFSADRLGWICGPCALESESVVRQTAEALCRLSETTNQAFVFKGSFDKANRTSDEGARGPGIQEGTRLLRLVRQDYGLPTITDIHEAWQAAELADAVDALQIPAFLCRQTDLIKAAAATDLPVVIKRGQFMAPGDMRYAVAKTNRPGNVLLVERGTSFGYNDLVVDYRALPVMRKFAPVIFDGTHAVQQPGAAGGASGGAREFIVPLARAALAVGCDGLFLETHPDPENAISDRATQLSLATLRDVVQELSELHTRLYP